MLSDCTASAVTSEILTGIFAADYVVQLDGFSSIPGWIDGHFVQLEYQLAGSTAFIPNFASSEFMGMAYSFVVSYLVLYPMDFVPFLKLSVSAEAEPEGVDASEMGEYTFEAVSLKMTQWDGDDLVGEAVADEHGGVHSKN